MRMTLENVSNVALIATCVLTSTVLVARYVRPARTTNDAPMLPFSVGQQMTDLRDISYEQSAATLVLYAKSTCPYCTLSMPFYRHLLELPALKARKARFTVASVEPAETVMAYFQEYGIS